MVQRAFRLCFSLLFLSLISWGIPNGVAAQADSCGMGFKVHRVASKHLGETRDFWVSLPYDYSDTNAYRVLYVLDAEWRFDLVRLLEFDQSANGLIDPHIVVGIPHVEWEVKRQKDLSFSQSRMEYDGEPVDSTWYNVRNAGGAEAFYRYLTQEVMPQVEALYATNGHNSLLGHSMGGYFGGYLLSRPQPFSTLYLYDPSAWYSDGEMSRVLGNGLGSKQKVQVVVTYQPIPAFHKSKVEEFITTVEQFEAIELHTKMYAQESHNSLFLPSFYWCLQLLREERSP
ncbi:MAG: alpha/beta hydrolase [Salibacteraceae bacterium]